MKNKILTIAFFTSFSLGGGYLFAMFADRNDAQLIVRQQEQAQTMATGENASPKELLVEKKPPIQPVESKVETAIGNIKFEVPFVVQAPLGNWSDPVFQNACEEASIIMAMAWIKDIKTISPTDAKKQIQEITDFENKNFGYNADTDVSDVQKIFQQFFHYQNITPQENISAAEIKNELQNGNLVIVPVLGRKLGNPNFTPPGPVVHMLVITGYDSTTKEFITNDPGTRLGKDYHYGEKTLFDAIWNYPSGKSTPAEPVGILKKTMVVVRKK